MTISSILFALLVSGAAAQAPPEPQTQPGARAQTADKLVCRTREVTGSLVKKRKVCQVQATWEKQAESYREQWSPLQGTHGNSRGN